MESLVAFTSFFASNDIEFRYVVISCISPADGVS